MVIVISPFPGFQSPPGLWFTFLGSGIPTNKPTHSFATIDWHPGIPSLKLTVRTWKWWFPSPESPFSGGPHFQGQGVRFEPIVMNMEWHGARPYKYRVKFHLRYPFLGIQSAHRNWEWLWNLSRVEKITPGKAPFIARPFKKRGYPCHSVYKWSIRVFPKNRGGKTPPNHPFLHLPNGAFSAITAF